MWLCRKCVRILRKLNSTYCSYFRGQKMTLRSLPRSQSESLADVCKKQPLSSFFFLSPDIRHEDRPFVFLLFFPVEQFRANVSPNPAFTIMTHFIPLKNTRTIVNFSYGHFIYQPLFQISILLFAINYILCNLHLSIRSYFILLFVSSLT